jgi:carboxymethylenebutenolidase
MPLGRRGSQVELAAGAGDLSAYLALPAGRRGPGVLVVHEAFGLGDHVREVCERLAREGFVALAPDLYRGRSTSEPETAARWLAEQDVAAAERDLDAALRELLSRDATDGPRVAAVGFGTGGPLALRAATRSRRIGAVAELYAAHSALDVDLAGLEAPVLAILAQDGAAPAADAARALSSRLAAAGVRGHVRVQPGTRCGFMDESRADVYDARAAAESWDTLLAFLRAELA